MLGTVESISNEFLQHLTARLQRLEDGRSLRDLVVLDGLIDFCSNDYLSLARCGFDPVAASVKVPANNLLGATGSRLISGNTVEHEDFEQYLANFHRAEAALVFGSGYLANVGVLACLLQRGDTIIFDKLCHASIRDGIRLSAARSFGFSHNDVSDLRSKLAHASGQILVVVESLYSMDGDFAPLQELVQVVRSAGAELYVDEAHTTGVSGLDGAGLVVALGLEHEVLIRLHTWGKAVASHGACVVGPEVVRRWLVNRARTFIYSTANPVQHVREVRQRYQQIAQCHAERQWLHELSSYAFGSLQFRFGKRVVGSSTSPIMALLIPGNEQVLQVAARCRESGFAVVGIRSPTVPLGSERIRICVHTHNTRSEIDALLDVLEVVLQEYRSCAVSSY